MSKNPIKFVKMHGNGNDFIIIDELQETKIPEKNKPTFAEKHCKRRFAIGADGVLYLQPSKTADLKMRIFNSDGTEADMCGNGIRCAAKYATENIVTNKNVDIETGAGTLNIETDKNDKFWAKVDMGKPKYNKKTIPAKGKGEFINQEIENTPYQVSACNVGVPHAVIQTDDVESIDIIKQAPPIRNNPIFPEGANVNFIQKTKNGIKVRTFERGVEAETLSCGTGSVASAAIAKKTNLIKGNTIKVQTKGGKLNIIFKNNTAYMKGPAQTAYNGTLTHPQ
ncbi:diaminopimelate epimerase [Methanonatronarchaeum sp. AMET-Sl]|uniref:diaminopimelate epimerase n=1 Tax=Methanonatronarchaeum sp. AMET-Sl TaxID=3037654 RepID=UPI00244E5967|nr:diaminopimelate epimerase [Methanonatronarchaeum sp. AMET-Sl]WGI17436.1 diaminopimelate epimerase [Methanonatronarchaeum sp. AMET-Sl]